MWTEQHSKIARLFYRCNVWEILKSHLKTIQDIDIFHYENGITYNLLFHAIESDNFSAFKAILRQGANPLLGNIHGITPIHLLMEKCRLEWVYEMSGSLFKNEFNQMLNAKDHIGLTPLISSIRAKNFANAYFLLRSGAEVNATMHDGWSALHEACQREIPELVQLLIDFGADVTKKACYSNSNNRLVTPKKVTHNEYIHKLFVRNANQALKYKKFRHDEILLDRCLIKGVNS